MPCAAPARAASASSAVCSSALVGTQPRCRQVPPSLSRSTRATLRPSWAARSAAAYPPLPPPRTTTSYSWFTGLLDDQPQGVFEGIDQRGHPLRGQGAVDGSVVDGEDQV